LLNFTKNFGELETYLFIDILRKKLIGSNIMDGGYTRLRKKRRVSRPKPFKKIVI